MPGDRNADTRRGVWTLAVLALVAYALAAHIPIFVTDPDTRTYASGHIDVFPINLGAPFALLYAALLTVLARRWFGSAGVPTSALMRAVCYVALLAVGFLGAFLAYVGASLTPAIAVFAQVAVWSVFAVVFIPFMLVGMAVKGIPAATLVTLAVLGVPSVGPLTWLVWRARGERISA